MNLGLSQQKNCVLLFFRCHGHCHCRYLLWRSFKCDTLVLYSSLSFAYCDEHRFFLLFGIAQLLSTMCTLHEAAIYLFAYLNLSGNPPFPCTVHCTVLLQPSWCTSIKVLWLWDMRGKWFISVVNEKKTLEKILH